MPYFIIEDFSGGLDRRKTVLTAPSGSLRELKNCNITPGGEIEKREAFVPIITDFPATAKGLASVLDKIYVFSHQAETFTAPAGGQDVRTLVLVGGNTPPDWANDQNYGVGSRRTDPADGSVWTCLVEHTSPVSGTFAEDRTANPDRWKEAFAKAGPLTGINQILDWDLWDGRIYVTLLDDQDDVRHFWQDVDSNGDLADTAQEILTQNGSRWIRTFQSKIYGVRTRFVEFTDVPDPAQADPVLPNWDPDNPADSLAGFINLATQDAESDTNVGLEIYYDNLVIQSRRVAQIWLMDPDPALSLQTQVLRSAGTIAPRSPRQYGSGDVLFLADSGIRSLRARDSSNAAVVSDIGSPLDDIFTEMFHTQPPTYITAAISLIEPVTGRFWVIFPDCIFVLSNFPGPKITAWSQYKPEYNGTPFLVEDAAVYENHIILRDATSLYLGGGDSEMDYDTSEALVQLPMLDTGSPATNKTMGAIDVTCVGTWNVEVATNPEQPDVWDQVAVIDGSTFAKYRIPFQAYTTHVALRLKTSDASKARLGNIMFHYEDAEAS